MFVDTELEVQNVENAKIIMIEKMNPAAMRISITAKVALSIKKNAIPVRRIAMLYTTGIANKNAKNI